MEENFYFTHWIRRHGRDNFEKLTKKVCSKICIPKKVLDLVDKDDYLFNYFYVTYLVLSLDYFGLKKNEISLVLDLSLLPGISKLYPVKDILENQQDAIPDIKKYIEKDLKLYD